MSTVLDKILAHKRDEVAQRKRERSLASVRGSIDSTPRELRSVLAAPGPQFIFEVKKASPSRGPIRPDLDLPWLLELYEHHATAISVLTDAHFFGGCDEDLRTARRLTSRPLLRKDFVVDRYQVVEARALGADAVLLIVAALEQSQLIELQAEARDLGLDTLVEVHDEAELDRALAAGADLVGVNNRNLKDLSVDLAVTERLAPRIPDGVVLVSESGLASRADVRRLAPHADAFLIGSSILAAADPAAQIKALTYGRVKICGLTRRSDAELALAGGASWAGFVLHGPSPRSVTPEQCAGLTRGLPGATVGVFVEQGAAEIVSIAQRCGLSAVQLHGPTHDEATVTRIKDAAPSLTVIRVLPVHEQQVRLPDSAADLLLLDTHDPGTHGGTGRRFATSLLTDLLAQERDQFQRRVLLAGGLNPDNAADAAALEPYGLDLSSGLESAPGVKDHEKIAQLFAMLRRNGESTG